MKKLIVTFTIFFLFSGKTIFSQSNNDKIIIRAPETAAPEKEPEIYDRAEIMPSFVGGMDSLKTYISRNLQRPETTAGSLEGNVMVKFIVDKKGNIKEPAVLKDLVGNGAAAEALRLVRSMPKWLPGKQNGQAVNTFYTLAIHFKL